jgi:hypothetical protein
MKSFRAWAKDSKEPEMKRNAQETVDTVNMYHYTSQFKNMKNLIRNNPEELKRIEAGLSKEELECALPVVSVEGDNKLTNNL